MEFRCSKSSRLLIDGPTPPRDPRKGDLLNTLRGHSQRVTSVSFLPNGSLLASSSLDGRSSSGIHRPDRNAPFSGATKRSGVFRSSSLQMGGGWR
ncbi:MAG: hypothetical protein DME22_04915 [Verrucomicrobia bacterium]|nr:MAG: hypothetical protein DME22_04915 [Verrucomicrobiota bacterium]PYJ96496.1 MAG: hypothetical protein DME23_20340 [Verrucomicrobiota bacterium]